MKRSPFASQKCAPWARCTKRGVPPTARKARTGEFTPPGISARARSNRSELGAVLCVMRGKVEGFGRAAAGIVVVLAFAGIGLGPEQAVGHHVAHAGTESAIEAAIEVREGFHGGGGEVG